CGQSKVFVVPIPVGNNGSDDFWVDGLSFQPVDKGERIVVSIYGDNFSPQTGVLVKGVPLIPSIGMAQPLIRDDSNAGRAAATDAEDQKIHGMIERVDAEQMVISFQMPDDFVGTPAITLIAPGKAIDLNWLKLRINGSRNRTTLNDSDPMFGPPDPSFAISGAKVFRDPKTHGLAALVSGKGLDQSAEVFVNGADL